ncbi:MAG TPA: diadenylate cyclase CdaA [Syntrophomonadaceae bacterium]|nr:diadenylate cyclase CdaA [Syntrophomonadaceae bacterium]HRX21786.1 diadenylate cyclase CdaA [Syntrophomonadaceae bacterium]
MDLSFLAGVFASPLNIIRSVLDIGIVAYVFYRILSLIQGTRAAQLVKGLGLLLVFSLIASFLKLDMVNWIMGKLWIAFAVALPIVFQPELRRILEQIGRGSFFRLDSLTAREASEGVINEVVQAASILSLSKTGALMVITRETGINEYLQTGVPMDSIISASLLVNIFVPNTPLHDGAVIITEGRISHAACFLPLSDNPALPQELGTRHRAGIGITEVSDALTVTISEETGTISIASEGQITRDYNTVTLREALRKELAPRESWQETWKRRWAGENKNQEH